MHTHESRDAERSAWEWAEFYHAFEERFRGSYETIHTRLAARYSERLRGLASAQAGAARHIDLGCGRGEFLAVARACGFDTAGCDASAVAVAACGSHDVRQSDILSYLKSQGDKSATLVSLLHVIEHCPAPYILQVFKEVGRVLADRGAFLVETPSLFSLWASQRQFYLDPTHERPVHPDYITFMGEYAGLGACERLAFDAVEHPERGSHTALASLPGEVGDTLRKWDAWFFGPMDIAFWLQKH